ncbi:YcdB/YcdC domain-containing protein [Methanolobus profundi]|uniref:YcdB/YcdC repeated domain-containing protein n=1 Tax=Methanolobus profundi TaxID=487685 RepID=A0A1I4P0W6_9EURY|nr:YcdB/YcdC domain-containing protein [Methanolobus profundi]SFM21412.1 hypothetical protein SAMN04488696_0390 [Methanolobus profundi]
MKFRQLSILTLIIVSAMFLAFASEEGAVLFTKENESCTKYLDSATTETDIAFEDAELLLKSEAPEVIVKSTQGELLNKENYGLIWQVSAETTNGRHVVAGVDASNGDLLFIYDGSKKVKGNMNISKEEALKVAEDYIQSRLTVDKLNEIELENVKYKEPAADNLPTEYKISYARIIRGVPSLSDGIQIRVNAETGEVTSYRIRWAMSEKNMTTFDTEPSIMDSEASKILKEYMANEPTIGIEKANTLDIISSDLVWKENNGTTTLAWWIQFKDSSFEENAYPGAAWIDAYSGEILTVVYSGD